MATIDKTKPVLVTGATGYIAGWLIKQLLENGITVHAAVRNPNDEKKLAHLNALAKKTGGKIIYFKSDLLSPGAYTDAIKDCELVFHLASPFILDVKDPQKDLIDPALLGTSNVLASVNQTPTVKRVVLTSSCAAIYTDAIDCQKAPGGILTEDCWNTTSSVNYQPYSYSKTLAEKKAWEIVEKQSRWDLVTINPSLVMGPMLDAKGTTSESLNILKQMGDGTMKAGAPEMGIGLVDVRDVANAHFLAGYTPLAKGRYITSAYNTNFLEMALALQAKFGKQFPIPSRKLPKWLLMLIGPFLNKQLTRRYIKNNVGVDWKADNSKIVKDFNIQFKPLKETMEDAFQVLVDEKILLPK